MPPRDRATRGRRVPAAPGRFVHCSRYFFAPQGFLAAHGFFAAQGLAALAAHGFLAAQGFLAAHGLAALAAQGFLAAHGLAFWASAAGAAPMPRTATTERAPRVCRITQSPPSGRGMAQVP
ncbi:MAG: hypothetical protein A3D33_07365 [Candidatus Rokubacteria bacterium RIFCSPHIGHO2_02_FULL_73_26]|nr:MAG: hypothetical protein A3D33_07365 [Candidatus Rokubacteria bacterium RIFCSPHIGHO2_02_FULL_73_26]